MDDSVESFAQPRWFIRLPAISGRHNTVGFASHSSRCRPGSRTVVGAGIGATAGAIIGEIGWTHRVRAGTSCGRFCWSARVARMPADGRLLPQTPPPGAIYQPAVRIATDAPRWCPSQPGLSAPSLGCGPPPSPSQQTTPRPLVGERLRSRHGGPRHRTAMGQTIAQRDQCPDPPGITSSPPSASIRRRQPFAARQWRLATLASELSSSWTWLVPTFSNTVSRKVSFSIYGSSVMHPVLPRHSMRLAPAASVACSWANNAGHLVSIKVRAGHSAPRIWTHRQL